MGPLEMALSKAWMVLIVLFVFVAGRVAAVQAFSVKKVPTYKTFDRVVFFTIIMMSSWLITLLEVRALLCSVNQYLPSVYLILFVLFAV